MSINAKIFEDAPGTGGYSGPVTGAQLHAALGASGLDSGAQESIYNTLIPKASSNTGGGNSGGGSSAPGYNYTDLINQDALFGQQKTDLAAESASDAANRAAAIQRALIQWGIVPDFASEADKLGLSKDSLGMLQSDIAPGTKDLADKNTKEGLSIYARLQKQHTDQIRAIKNALAARGMAASGEMGAQLGDEAQAYKQQLTDSEQQLLQYITGAIAAFTGAERERNRTLSQYMMDAAGRAQGRLGDSGGGDGSGGSGGSGGPSGVDMKDFQYDATPQGGYSIGEIANAAAAHAPAGQKVGHLMDQGQIHYVNGVPGVSIKYFNASLPGQQGGNTIWVPLNGPPGSGGGGSTTGGGTTSGGSTAPANTGGLFGSDFGG